MIARLALAVTLGHPGDAWFGPDKMKHFFVAAFTHPLEPFATLPIAIVEKIIHG